MADSVPLIWVLTDDRPGNAAQALGVATALRRPFVRKSVAYGVLAGLPNALRGATLVGVDGASRRLLEPPWPDVVIAAGRRTAPVARWIKHRAGKLVVLAQIMNPGNPRAFDLVAVPGHDRQPAGGDPASVVRITGAPHGINQLALQQAMDIWAPRLAGLPRPFVTLLVGGATRRRPFPAVLAAALGRDVARMARDVGGSVLLATSRRTGSEAERILESAIPEPRSLFLWGRGGDNPYLGFLALADAVVVTGDSVSMCSEACATPAPVWIYAPAGFVTPKHARLHRELYAAGYARPFDGHFADWTHPPLNAAGDIAVALEAAIGRAGFRL